MGTMIETVVVDPDDPKRWTGTRDGKLRVAVDDSVEQLSERQVVVRAVGGSGALLSIENGLLFIAGMVD